MSDHEHKAPSADIARPLAFTLTMIYGLLSFLSGYQDWQGARRLEPWADWALILCGVLLGSTAIRVLMRRRPAFTQGLVALLALFVIDLFTDLNPGAEETWRYPLGRAALSAVILLLLWRTDRALPPTETRNGDVRDS